MKKYEEVYNAVKNKLTDHRFYHSICTVERAVEYAKIYGENEEKIKLLAIAHDIAKQLKDEEIEEIIKKYNIKLDELEKGNLALSHSKIGAAICKEEFEFEEDMCSAISYHTTGKENMTLMEKIIFVADATGKDRHFEDTEKIYEIAKEDIDLAIVEILKETIKDVLENNKKIHINTIKAYNYYTK